MRSLDLPFFQLNFLLDETYHLLVETCCLLPRKSTYIVDFFFLQILSFLKDTISLSDIISKIEEAGGQHEN